MLPSRSVDAPTGIMAKSAIHSAMSAYELTLPQTFEKSMQNCIPGCMVVIGIIVLGDAVGSEVEGSEVDLEGSGVMGPVVMAGWLGSDAVGAEIGAAVGPRVLGSEMLGSDVGPTVGGRVKVAAAPSTGAGVCSLRR